jgi:adenylylsulfate kinase
MTGRKSGFAVWLTGRPASGKSALAAELKRLLDEQGVAAQLLDSDELRKHLTPRPTYTAEERQWFYGMIVFLAELLTGNGVNVLIAATAARREYRDGARRRIDRFAEVHVDCPVALCRQRDPKGLWRLLDRGEIRGLPGADLPYEAPAAPEFTVDTSQLTIAEAGRRLLEGLRAMGFWGEPAAPAPPAPER